MKKILDIRAVYLMYRFPGYWKIGISSNADYRRTRIDKAVRGRVFKLIALPFVFAGAWEHVILTLTAPLERCPPLRRKYRDDAGRSEWRWLPFGWLLALILLLFLFFVQVAGLVYLGTWALMDAPVNLFSMTYELLNSK